MKKSNLIQLDSREAPKSILEEIVRQGAQRMLQAAIEAEVDDFLAKNAGVVDTEGRRVVVRNGHMPERDLVTGVGPISVRQPRVRDKSGQQKFTSKILPPFLRRLPSVDTLIPILYLKGVSTNDFSEALEAILGPNATGLSATNIVRLKDGWTKEFGDWSKRKFKDKRYVYFWVDGLHFNVRLEKDRPCVLVIMGATPEGKKELVAVWDGHRESKNSWQTVLRDLKSRGLTEGPKLAIGDGALGFWGALEEEFPDTKEQRCWVHKTANILDKLPKGEHPDAKKLIHEMYMASTEKAAKKAFKEFVRKYETKQPKAVECLVKDKDVLFTFYSFPAEHWAHIRTTNPIESTFATVRHRTRQTKGCGSRLATMAMVYKLGIAAAKRWRRLNGSKLLGEVIEGTVFVDGEINEAAA